MLPMIDAKARRGLFLLLAVLSLATLGLGCERRGKGDDTVSQETPPVLVEVSPVEKGQREQRYRYSGITYPWEARGLGFMVAGRITSIEVEQGDWVEPGQLLATIQPDDYQLVEQLADVQVKALRPNYKRVSELVRRGALPDIKLDEIEGQYKAARTQRKQAERQVAYTRLEAPARGIVMEKRAAVGQVTGAGMPVVVVLDVEQMKAKFGVSQRDLRCFAEGKTVTLDIPGLEGAREGRVHNIAFVPDTRTRTYDVTVALPNPAHDVRAGMTAHVSCVMESAEGFFVPIGAVKRSTAGQKIVLVLDEVAGLVRERSVEVGEIYGRELEITSGLAGGERIVTKGQSFVRDGAAVRVQGSEK